MTDQAPTQGDDPVPDTQADPAADPSVRPGDGDGNTADRPPEVTGGQPKVGDDLPRNTEF